jgi:hypothetical protein
MKIISRKLHAVLDYMSGMVLIAAPWVLKFNNNDAGSAVAVAAGIFILIMSIMTDNEGGIIRSVSMPLHLNLDIILGLVLAASPWIFGFKEDVYLPHLILGLFVMASGFITERSSLSSRMAR